jgi:hypothetical protein
MGAGNASYLVRLHVWNTPEVIQKNNEGNLQTSNAITLASRDRQSGHGHRRSSHRDPSRRPG